MAGSRASTARGGCPVGGVEALKAQTQACDEPLNGRPRQPDLERMGWGGLGEGWGDGAVSAAAEWALRREASHCQSHLSVPDPGQPPQPPALAGSSVLLGVLLGPGSPGQGGLCPPPAPCGLGLVGSTHGKAN